MRNPVRARARLPRRRVPSAARSAVLAFLSSMLALAPAGIAQVTLPSVPVPDLPVDLPVDVDRTLSDAKRRLDPRGLRDVRLLRVRELLRKHRDVIEADASGAPILRSEVLAYSPTDAAIERARAAGYAVLRQRSLEPLDIRILVLRAPPGLSTRRALKDLRALDPDGTYDFNHVYTESGPVNSPAADQAPPQPTSPPGSAEKGTPATRVGLIDAGVDRAHPAFQDVAIHAHGCSGQLVPSAHGTAVASLLVGRATNFHGSAPGAMLFAADVYCGQPTGGAVDAVADAFGWLARERVATISVSLVGPPNGLLENVVRAVIARGHIVVAAVGNDGPAARPLFPAAYAGVVGVTGVDARRRALVEAGRGPHVDFAAPGADMAAANATRSYVAVRGTSFAAPIVAGLLAQQLLEPDGTESVSAISTLARQAIDLGARGPDRTYGNGLVGEKARIDLAIATGGG